MNETSRDPQLGIGVVKIADPWTRSSIQWQQERLQTRSKAHSPTLEKAGEKLLIVPKHWKTPSYEFGC